MPARERKSVNIFNARDSVAAIYHCKGYFVCTHNNNNNRRWKCVLEVACRAPIRMVIMMPDASQVATCAHLNISVWVHHWPARLNVITVKWSRIAYAPHMHFNPCASDCQRLPAKYFKRTFMWFHWMHRLCGYKTFHLYYIEFESLNCVHCKQRKAKINKENIKWVSNTSLANLQIDLMRISSKIISFKIVHLKCGAHIRSPVLMHRFRNLKLTRTMRTDAGAVSRDVILYCSNANVLFNLSQVKDVESMRNSWIYHWKYVWVVAVPLHRCRRRLITFRVYFQDA